MGLVAMGSGISASSRPDEADETEGRFDWLWTGLLHVSLAAVVAMATVAMASAGMFLTTAPETVSLLFEPLSLLLMPGLLVSLLVVNAHDYSPPVVVETAFVFYFLFFLAALWVWSRKRLHAHR